MSNPVRSLRLQGKTTSTLDVITGDSGEIFWDKTANCLRLYTGAGNMRGGTRLLTETNIQDYNRISEGTPASDDPGTAGEIRYDADYIYVCVATDTWLRSALSTY